MNHTRLGDLLRLGVPIIGVNAGLTAMQLTDAWMVGALGPEPLAALTPPGMLLFVAHSAGYGLLSVLTALVAQAGGAGRIDECGRFGWQGLFLAAACGGVAVATWPLAPAALAVFPHDGPAILAQEVAYLRVGALGVGPGLAAVALSNVFVAVRRTRVVLVATFVAFMVNVVTDVLLVFGHAGMPALGLTGAAWGTVAGATAQAGLLVAAFVHPSFAGVHGVARWRPAPDLLARMVRVGGPAGVQAAVEVAAWGLVMTWLIAWFGTAHLAAATVLVRCMQLTFLPAEGIAQATQCLVGDAVGAGRPGLARAHARLGFWVVAPYMTALGAMMFIVRAPLMRAFSADPEVVAIGASAMVFVAALQFFDAMAVVYVHVLQGVGDNEWPLQATLTLVLVVLVGGGAGVIRLAPELGSVGIWAVAFVYMSLLGLAFWYRWRAGLWTEIRLLPAPA